MAKKKTTSGTAMRGVGAAVIVAFLIGMYSGIPGFGGGEGTAGEGEATAATNGGPIEAESDLTETGLEDRIVTVLIDAHQYAVLTKHNGQTEYRAASVDQVVQLARVAQGDDTGVRVKVLRRETARASAEEHLRGSLVQAGIPAASIYWPKQFIP